MYNRHLQTVNLRYNRHLQDVHHHNIGHKCGRNILENGV
ncbi:hypothetical protein CCACVL1_08472 [Corchorus capsularis]|uniref:Uncharacterized protein n=1 Tax=Corchorus capsularis TaxID=210143 RepID=A0A1R3J0F6_COCAP|nr:hypothetical protein CCACVL1_08472 [Corchorus capsularis]